MDTPTAMSSVVSALTSILTTDAMFTNLAALIPVVGGVLIFAFTYRIIVRIVKGAQKDVRESNRTFFLLLEVFL